jgi:hypothetical protein
MARPGASVRRQVFTIGGSEVQVLDASLFTADRWHCLGCNTEEEAVDLAAADAAGTAHACTCRTQPTRRSKR